MPKEFPQIRLHGHKETALQHVKRGMLELFKTQSIKDRANVPILKRSVETQDGSRIIVQIAHDQTFIDITSGAHQEITEEELPEEELKYEECPRAFIIRKSDPDSRSGVGGIGMEQEQGYIIAYNRAADKWQLASYTDSSESGNTFAHASNIGWWHVKNGEESNVCDVITWYGGANFDFQPQYIADPVDYTAFQQFFFFKGRQFQAPIGNVLGACIIDDGGVDYMYVLTYNAVHYANGGRDRIGALWTHRMTVSSLLGGSTTWEAVSTRTFDDFNINLNNPVREWFETPRQSAYIDEDGYAYLLLQHQEHLPYPEGFGNPDSEILVEGATSFIKLNLRDDSFEMLDGCTRDSYCLRTFGGAWDGVIPLNGNIVWGTPGDQVDFFYRLTNTGRPWVAHMIGGGHSLWTYEWEWDIQAEFHGIAVDEDDFALDSEWFFENGFATGHIDVIVKKDGVEQDRIRILEMTGDWEVERGVREEEFQDVWIRHTSGRKTRTIIEHNPEIKDSLRYVEQDIIDGGASTIFRLFEDGQEKVLGTQMYPLPVPVVSGGGYDVGVPWSPTVNWQRLIGSRQEWYIDDDTGMDGTEYEYCNTIPSRDRVEYEWGISDYVHHEEHPEFAAPAGVQGVMALGTRTSGTLREEFGSAIGFHVVRNEGGSVHWDTESYAVHRHVEGVDGGEKPYIHVRRPINGCVKTSPVNFNGIGDEWDRIRIADANPLSADESSPDPYGQPTDAIPGTGPIYSRRDWIFWTKPLGFMFDDEYPTELNPGWKDEDWEFRSNILTEKQLDKLTKELDNAFFEIAVL